MIALRGRGFTAGCEPFADIAVEEYLKPMNPYFQVDHIIDKWVEALGTKLFREWAGAPARSFHTSGDPPFECFQIWIESPKAGRICVHAAAVDTNDDTERELEANWEGPTDELDGMLATAVDTINRWKVRTRTKPNPASPWS